MRLKIGLVGLLAATAFSQLYGAKPPACSDIATQWALNDYHIDGTLTAIRGDGLGLYRNGQAGVTATIQICNGTTDAVLMTGSGRQLSFDFTKMLASNSQTPSWASGIITGSGATLHIRKITFVPAAFDRAQEYAFTTRAGSILPVKSWNFRMWKPTTDAVSGDPSADIYLDTANGPFWDSAVIVHHCPANSTATEGPCVGIVKETWFVYPDAAPTIYTDGSPAPSTATQIGALVNTQKPTPVNGGQFSMSFYFVISVL
jgi:hypothetical protein